MVRLELSGLQTESRNARTTNIDNVSTSEMCTMMNEEDAGVAGAVKACIPDIAAAIDATAPRVRVGGRLIYVGAGTSGRLGVVDASEIQPTFSAPAGQFVGVIAGGDAAIRMAQEGAEDSADAAALDLEALQLDGEKDTVIGIAASGRTPYVLACLKYAKLVGCLTLGLACSFPSEMSKCTYIDHMISVVTGPEVITGSTRMKAGTGTKLALNMLSTGVMVKIGKTYGNMMVDVQSSNLKLKQRSRNIIRSIGSSAKDLTDDQLDTLISDCGGSVKLAMMTLLSGLSVQDCTDRLQAAGGVLKTALDTWEDAQTVTTPDVSASSDDGAAQHSGLVVCIDGGGSKCAVAIADPSGHIGHAEGGSCNFTDLPLQAFKSVVVDTTRRALDNYLQVTSSEESLRNWQLGSSEGSPFSAALAGISGLDRPGANKAFKPMLREILGLSKESSVEVMNDTDLLTSALRKYPDCRKGVVLIAGTGSVAMSFELSSKSGKFERNGRSGGWGHILGDEGSGFDIGKQAIKAMLKKIENSRKLMSATPTTTPPFPSPFEQAIMGSLGITESWSPSLDLLSKILKPESGECYDLKTRVAGVARAVLENASSDIEAAHIVSTAANHLIALLQPFISQENSTTSDSVLILSGGLMKCPPFRSIFLGKLAAEKAQFRAIEIVEDPASTGVLSMISAMTV